MTTIFGTIVKAGTLDLVTEPAEIEIEPSPVAMDTNGGVFAITVDTPTVDTDYNLEIEVEGYEDAEVTITVPANAVFLPAGNIELSVDD